MLFPTNITKFLVFCFFVAFFSDKKSHLRKKSDTSQNFLNFILCAYYIPNIFIFNQEKCLKLDTYNSRERARVSLSVFPPNAFFKSRRASKLQLCLKRRWLRLLRCLGKPTYFELWRFSCCILFQGSKVWEVQTRFIFF